jgi:predicted nucleic acid-binding protein
VETVVVDRQLIEDAVDCSILNQLSFWDALIVTSAAAARCTTLLTEDLNHGQTIAGVRVEHPMRFPT